MGFNFGAFAKGFAERDMELRDEAREAARTRAAATAKFALENAWTKNKEIQATIKTYGELAKKLRKNFNYNDAQLATLADQGKLEDALKYHEMAQLKKINIAPEVVVTQAVQLPDGATFDSFLEKIVVGNPTKFEQKDLYPVTQKQKSSNPIANFLELDTTKFEREQQEAYYESSGMDTQKIMNLSRDAYTPIDLEGGVVDMTAFSDVVEKDTTPKDWRTTVQSAIKSSGRNAISAMLQLDTEVNPYDGSLIYNSDKREMTETAYLVEDAMTQELHRRLRANPEADYSVEMNNITADYRRAVGDKRGAAAVTASFAWANSITGGNITAPTITEEPVPEPEPKSTIDWTNPNIDTDLRTVMTEDQWDKYSRLQKSSPEQARKYAEGLGLTLTAGTDKGTPEPTWTVDSEVDAIPDDAQLSDEQLNVIIQRLKDAGVDAGLVENLRDKGVYKNAKAVLHKAKQWTEMFGIPKEFDGTVTLGGVKYKLEGDPAVIEATKGWITSNETAYRKAAEQAGLKLVPVQ